MEYIVSHANTDFDSLAAMIAASKLYPVAKMVFSGKLNNEVKAFMAFYKDIFDIKVLSQIDLDKTKKLIVVDTALGSRIGKFAKVLDQVELHIYDHHVDNKDLMGFVHQVEEIGATTTMLVEKIQDQVLILSAIEATVMLLGIYSDTDCLTYSSTTKRDVLAVAYLLGMGANLQIVRDFLGRPLEELQKDILNALLNSAETYNLNGVQVMLTFTETDDYVEGLSILAFKIQDIEHPDALFILAKMGNRVHIVGRSKVDEIAVRDILEPFGGGGHQKAASAVVKGKGLEEVKALLYQGILLHAKPMHNARELMSSPVKTIAPETTIKEADHIMIRYGHTGVPIVDAAGVMKGIISRRDIDKARQHGFLGHPVKGFMSSKIITITPETQFQEIQKLIIEHDIGRLPVLEEGQLVGIVSRTDVLRSLYAGEQRDQGKKVTQSFYLWKNVSKIMKQCLSLDTQALLKQIGRIADQEEMQIYVVGGFVRDLILGRHNLDIDLVVEGNAPDFANILAEKLGGERKFESKFGTAQIVLADGLKLDIATARREYYEYPAMLPQVEEGSLKQDLYRRDFTINAMAVQLNEAEYGKFIDFFGGQNDLHHRMIRVLYNLSFIEDPTRIFRALRFEKRYRFVLEEETELFIKQALKVDVLRQVSAVRLKHEFVLIAEEKQAAQIIKRADELGVLRGLHPELHLDQETYQLFNKANARVNTFELGEKEKLLLYMLLLVYKMERKNVEQICNFLQLTEGQQNILYHTLDRMERIEQLLEQKELLASELYQNLVDMSHVGLVFLMFKSKQYLTKKRLLYYLLKLKKMRLEINGNDLMNLGFKPSPSFGTVLAKVKLAKMDKIVNNKEEELSMAEGLLCRELYEGGK